MSGWSVCTGTIRYGADTAPSTAQDSDSRLQSALWRSPPLQVVLKECLKSHRVAREGGASAPQQKSP